MIFSFPFGVYTFNALEAVVLHELIGDKKFINCSSFSLGLLDPTNTSYIAA